MQTETPDQVYQPNATEVSGPSCFLEQARVCGPDCIAYLPQPPRGEDYLGEQWANCMLLVNAHRGGKHLVIIANALNDFKERASKKEHPVTRQEPPGVR